MWREGEMPIDNTGNNNGNLQTPFRVLSWPDRVEGSFVWNRVVGLIFVLKFGIFTDFGEKCFGKKSAFHSPTVGPL